MGILHLPLQDKNRRIDISLDAPEKIRPNQDLKIRIKANPVAGQPLPGALSPPAIKRGNES